MGNQIKLKQNKTSKQCELNSKLHSEWQALSCVKVRIVSQLLIRQLQQPYQWRNMSHQMIWINTSFIVGINFIIQLITEFWIASSASKLKAKSVLMRDTIPYSIILNQVMKVMLSAANQIAPTTTVKLEKGTTIWVRSTESQQCAVRNLWVPPINSKTSLPMDEITKCLPSVHR